MEELIHARGYVIDRFISIEWMIKIIISQHYLGRTDQGFIFRFLGNDQLGFGFLRNTLIEVLGSDLEQEKINKMNKLNKIRNHFAHLGIQSNGRPNAPEAELFFVYPFAKDGTIDPQKEYDEYMDHFSPVHDWLMEISKKKGVTYIPSEA